MLGLRVRRGGLVLLDVHGTDHDPAHWDAPEHFDPERFLTGRVDDDALVPQGGGERATGHRCPGEEATRLLIRSAVRALAAAPDACTAPSGPIDLTRMPARP